ncbi:hypothetical protein ARMGADRAFT_605889 [Armillaria gallica]|uniref:Uncharacterized protein n=1 Tax=Armillaria gallica TaxID=47427 RepID=A0A2H3CT14_ARMGA|nr:hypothetical protein ARMGADRAFT_605889 [Armillaria gallica]
MHFSRQCDGGCRPGCRGDDGETGFFWETERGHMTAWDQHFHTHRVGLQPSQHRMLLLPKSRNTLASIQLVVSVNKWRVSIPEDHDPPRKTHFVLLEFSVMHAAYPLESKLHLSDRDNFLAAHSSLTGRPENIGGRSVSIGIPVLMHRCVFEAPNYTASLFVVC